jgi:hypothetical protein
MNNKLFWPIVLVSIVIIVESVLLLSNNKNKKVNVEPVKMVTSEEVKKVEPIISFTWLDDGNKTVLQMSSKKTVAIDAIDLYIAYKDVKVNSVTNVGDLPKPSFSKISTEKSLVVMNYLIPDAKGFMLEAGKTINVAELDLTILNAETAQFSIDPKTQVVENGTVKVLPY